jgi:hypothetical protein
MVVGAIVALVAAILFAALAYTLALPDNGSPITTHTRCDAALVQQFGTPKVGVVTPDSSSQGSTQPIGITVRNTPELCVPVAHYRLGIAAGLLIVALVLGGLVLMGARRDRRTAKEEEPLPGQP